MFNLFEDHELPLFQLKEQRRNLVLALAGENKVSAYRLAEIAALQQTIAAIEAVIIDLDAADVEGNTDCPRAWNAAAAYASFTMNDPSVANRPQCQAVRLTA